MGAAWVQKIILGVSEWGKKNDDWGSIPSKGRCFSVPHHIQAISGAHPVSYPLGTPCYLPGGRMSEHKPGQLPQSSGKMKKAWNCFCIIPYILWHCAKLSKGQPTFINEYVELASGSVEYVFGLCIIHQHSVFR